MSEPIQQQVQGGKTLYALTQVPTAFCIGGQTLIGYPGKDQKQTKLWVVQSV
jgi:hypothetical protein